MKIKNLIFVFFIAITSCNTVFGMEQEPATPAAAAALVELAQAPSAKRQRTGASQQFVFAVPGPVAGQQQAIALPEAIAPQQIEPATPATPAAADMLMELAQAPAPAPAAAAVYRAIGSLYTCAICHTAIDGYPAFLAHKRTHRDNLPFICTYEGCGFVCDRQCELDNHTRIHTKAKPFTCTQCGSSFTQRSNLNKHIKAKHSGEKSLQCPHCTYKTSRPDAFKQHIRIKHTAERPFKCPHCAFTAPSSCHLTYHIKTAHTREGLFQCPHCDYENAQLGHLKSHMQHHHPDVPMTPAGIQAAEELLVLAEGVAPQEVPSEPALEQ